MHDRFTERVRKVMYLAREEAGRLQHDYIGTEHLLLGIVREGEGIAASVLSNLDLDLDQIRQAVENMVSGSGGTLTVGEIPFTPRAKRVLELAPGGGQAALDAFTAAVLRASDASINQTALFGIPISTRVQAEFVATSGQPVRLANGGIAVVPEYATASASPRMCAFLGGLVAAGLRVSYLPWSRARQGVPVF